MSNRYFGDDNEDDDSKPGSSRNPFRVRQSDSRMAVLPPTMNGSARNDGALVTRPEPDLEQEVNDALCAMEADRLKELERTIQQGIRTFWTVGMALAEIRETRLYRETHRSFEAYCLERWEIARTDADRLIRAFAVLDNLHRAGCTALPKSVSSTVPLQKLPPEKQVEAWNEVTSGGKLPTRQQVEQAADKVQPRSKPKQPQMGNPGFVRGGPRYTGLAPVQQPAPIITPEAKERSQALERNAACVVLHKRLKEWLIQFGDRAKTAIELVDLLEQEIVSLTGVAR